MLQAIPHPNETNENGNYYVDSDIIMDIDKDDINTKHNGNCAMQMLLRQIALKKAEIMKNLETNGDKCALNNDIALLQELQRNYIDYEKQGNCCTLSRDAGVGSGDSQGSLSENSSSYRDNDPIQSTLSREIIKNDGEYAISIPNYILRGAGKETHYEYEIQIILQGEQWTILRRYSRFRELYLSMKRCYGEAVRNIYSINLI